LRAAGSTRRVAGSTLAQARRSIGENTMPASAIAQRHASYFRPIIILSAKKGDQQQPDQTDTENDHEPTSVVPRAERLHGVILIGTDRPANGRYFCDARR
jgi:hypothetical protein